MNTDELAKRVKDIVSRVDPYLSSGGVVKEKVHIPANVWNDLKQLANDLAAGTRIKSAGQSQVAERAEEAGVLLPALMEDVVDASDLDSGYASGWNNAVEECRRLNTTRSKM